MKTKKDDSLLPQLFSENLELGLSGTNISLKELRIVTGKTMSELGVAITEKICLLPAEHARSVWDALNEDSKNELTYHDYGAFNIGLIEKLNIHGRRLQSAFSSLLAAHIFELDNAPLSTPQYASAFNTIKEELLSTCKQLTSAKPDGKQRLLEYLGSFEIDFLASVVRHEIARYFIDEQGAEVDWDVVISTDRDSGDSEDSREYIEDEEGNEYDLLEEPSEFDEKEIERGELQEFKKSFVEGDKVPSALELTDWIQNNAPDIYSNIRNHLIFFSREQGINIWDRPNAAEPEAGTYEESAPVELNETGYLKYLFAYKTDALVLADAEREQRRLVRIYSISHPLRNNYQKMYLQDFERQGEFVAKILTESGGNTFRIQTFEELRKALWDAIGFKSLRQWINRQEEPKRLIESSGKKELFEEMQVLGIGAFGHNSILYDSFEKTKTNILKLYGWFCLVKIFWNITKQKKRFIDLATVINDTIVWEETITVNTLIFQAVLNTNNMFFSLEDVIKFCEAAKEPEWCATMKQAFGELAKGHDADSAISLFNDRIDILKELSSNIFLLGDKILLTTKWERELVANVKELVKNHFEDCMASIDNPDKSPKEVKASIQFSFSFRLRLIPNGKRYKKQAEDFLDFELKKSNFSEFSKLFDKSRKQSAEFDEGWNSVNENDDKESHDNEHSEINDEDFENSQTFKDVMDIIKKSGLDTSGSNADKAES